MANERFDVSMLELGHVYETTDYGRVQLDRWDTSFGQTTAEIILLDHNNARRNPLPETLAADIDSTRRKSLSGVTVHVTETIPERLAALLADAKEMGLNVRVWPEPLQPLAMGHHEMRAEVYPARYSVVETHAERKTEMNPLFAAPYGPTDAAATRDQAAQLNAAYAALDAVCEWARKEDANSETGSGTRLLALLLKHGVHPRVETGEQS